jgi:hypothetical protein
MAQPSVHNTNSFQRAAMHYLPLLLQPMREEEEIGRSNRRGEKLVVQFLLALCFAQIVKSFMNILSICYLKTEVIVSLV